MRTVLRLISAALFERLKSTWGASIEMTRPIRLCSRAQLQEDKTLGKTALAFAYGKVTYNGGESGAVGIHQAYHFLQGSPADVRAYAFEERWRFHWNQPRINGSAKVSSTVIASWAIIRWRSC